MKKQQRKTISYRSRDRFSKSIRKVVANTKNYSWSLNTPKGLDSLIERIEQNELGHETQKFIESSKFWQQISELTIDTKFLKNFQNLKCYRIISGRVNPLNIIGSKIHGGRFNIGSPQLRPHDEFPGIELFPSIYAAQSIECALAECGFPAPKNFKVYELTAIRDQNLWDLAEVIKAIQWPNLKSVIDDLPTAAAWIFQKVPSLSQLLALKLRAASGDGIFYPSTKKPDDKIYSFFVSSDVLETPDNLFSFSEVSP